MKKFLFNLLLAFIFVFPAFSQEQTMEMAYSTDVSAIQFLPRISTENRNWRAGGVFEGYKPQQEILSMRTEFSKKFNRIDGQVDVVLGGPFHYKSANGLWEDIDLDIKSEHTGNYVCESNHFKTVFGRGADIGVKMDYKNTQLCFGIRPEIKSLNWKPVSQSKPNTKVTENLIKYENLYDNIDLSYELNTDNILHKVVINNKTVFNDLNDDFVTFSEEMKLPKNAKLFDDLGQVEKVRKTRGNIHVVVGNDTLFTILQPRIWDDNFKGNPLFYSENNEQSNTDLHFLDFEVSFSDKEAIKLVANVDSKWLKDTGRKYPITFDPTITPGTQAYGLNHPFGVAYKQRKTQALYSATDIGMSGPITAIGYRLASANSLSNANTTIGMKNYSGSYSSGISSFQSGITNCYNSTLYYNGSTGWQDIALSSPFSYSNSSNLLVETSYCNSTTGTSASFYYTTPGPAVFVWDNRTSCGVTNATTYGYNIPATRITITANSCTGWYCSPNPISAAATGNVNYFSSIYATGSGCSCSVSALQSWLHFGAGASGGFNFYCDDNTTGSPRTGTFNIISGGSVVATLTVNQATTTCTNWYCSPNPINAPATGNVNCFTNIYTTGGNCTCSISAVNSWLHFSSAGTSGGFNFYCDDNTGAARTGTFNIISNGVVKTTLTVNQAASCSSLNLSANFTSVNQANGTVQFTSTSTNATGYNWDFGDGVGTSTQANPSYTYGSNQTYTVALIVSNGNCESPPFTADVIINNIAPPCALVASIAPPVDATCGLNNGQLVASATGNTGTLTYIWTDATGTNIGTTAIIPNLGPGIYDVLISESPTCSNTASATVANVGTKPVADYTYQIQANGVVAFSNTSTGTNTNTTYLWEFGDGTTSTLASPVHTYLNNQSYSVKLTVTNGTCTDEKIKPVLVSNIPVCSAFVLSASNVIKVDASCPAATDGSINIIPTSGTAPYTYSMNSVPVTMPMTNLGVSTYNYIVVDANKCTATISVAVLSGQALTTTATVVNPIPCSGGLGAVSVPASAGCTYLWNTGATTSNLTGVPTGNYSVTVTNTNGCTAVSSVVLTEPSPLTAIATITSPVSCANPQASINVSGSGGTAPYTGTGIFSVNAGNYSYTVTDANGCLSNTTIDVPSASSISLTAVVTPPKCSNETNGSIALSGTTGYNYSWNNGNTTSSITNLAAGNYSVVVSNATCSNTYSYTLTNPAMLIPVITSNGNTSLPAICAGTAVSLTANAFGGVSPYTYSWSHNLGTNASVSPSPSANTTYTVWITDANGCTKTNTFTVTTKASPTANAGVDKTVCNGNSTTIGTAGNALYTYSWFPATGLSANNIPMPIVSASTTSIYTVTVTRITSGCTRQDAVVVNVNNAPISAAITASNNNICEGAGNIILSCVSPSATLFKWYKDGVYVYSGANYTLTTALQSGKYVCKTQLSSTNTCVAISNEITVLINAAPIPVITPTGTSNVVTVCGSALPLVLSASATMNPSSFQWQYSTTGSATTYVNIPNATTNTLNVSTTAFYRVIATYPNGCTRTSVAKKVTVNLGCREQQILDSVSLSEVLSIHPNPFSDEFTLQFTTPTHCEVEFVNALGQLVLSKKVENEDRLVVDTKEWAIGLYIMKIKTKDGIHYTEKMLKY